jgi:hypothetical protein
VSHHQKLIQTPNNVQVQGKMNFGFGQQMMAVDTEEQQLLN